MLYALAVLLLVAWVVVLALKITLGVVHLLLVAAIVLFVAGWLRHRAAAGRAAP